VTIGVTRTIDCRLKKEAYEISWLKDGAPYTYVHYLHARQSTAQLGLATRNLNGSIFECFATFVVGDDPVLQKSWVIIVEGVE
jgi:hypothetical protein